MAPASPPLFPSDLVGHAPASPSVSLAGRVLVAVGGTWVIGDAFARVTASGGELPSVAPGALVVVRGTWDGQALTDARAVEIVPAPEPRGDGELARLIFDGVGPKLRTRSRILRAIREYFEGAGFVEVETPFAVPAPGVDRNVDAVSGGPGWLITSPELEMKRLIVGGVPRQFQIARVARRDEAGALHEPEFTLLEWYRAFSGIESVLEDTESVVAEAARAAQGQLTLSAPDGRRIDVRPPFERVTVRDAFREHADVDDASDLAASDEDRYFRLLVERVEPALARLDRPVFLCDYPITEAALARPTPADPRYAERFELYVAGIELSNGYGELTDPVEQRRRFAADRERRAREGRTVYPENEAFLRALEEGMPPSSGNALGVDRLIQLAVGATCIQDVIAFPRARL